MIKEDAQWLPQVSIPRHASNVKTGMHTLSKQAEIKRLKQNVENMFNPQGDSPRMIAGLIFMAFILISFNNYT